MESEWTAKQVRKQAHLEDLSASNSKTGDMLTAFAERIKADEGACEKAAVIWQYRRTSDAQWLDCDELDADAWKQTGLHEVRKLFTHPPTQPCAVPDGWRETFVELLEDYAGACGEVSAWNVTQRVQPDGGVRLPRPRLAKLMAHVDTIAAAPQPGES